MIEAWNSPLFTCDATSMSLPFPACFDTQSFALVPSVAAGSLRRLLLASQSPGLVTLPIWRKKKNFLSQTDRGICFFAGLEHCDKSSSSVEKKERADAGGRYAHVGLERTCQAPE